MNKTKVFTILKHFEVYRIAEPQNLNNLYVVLKEAKKLKT